MNLLKEHGLKTTKHRTLLLEILERHEGQLKSAEDLYRELDAGMDLSTLYRNLETFQEAGLIESATAEGKNWYRLCCHHSGHHHHLQCMRCKKIIHLPYCPQEAFEKLALEHHFVLKEHHLELYGLCHDCAQKEAEETSKN